MDFKSQDKANNKLLEDWEEIITIIMEKDSNMQPKIERVHISLKTMEQEMQAQMWEVPVLQTLIVNFMDNQGG